METSSTDGLTFTNSGGWQSASAVRIVVNPREQAHQRIDEALRRRRAAYVAYGRALAHPEYDLPQAERDARYTQLRAAIQIAEGDLAVALYELEELL